MSTGDVAIVTGGGSGLGRACVLELSRRGHQVLVADRNLDAAHRVAQEARSARGDAWAALVDVTDYDSVRCMVATASSRGPLRVAVNNAGVAGEGVDVSDYPLESWRSLMNVNLDGVFHCMKAEIPAIRAAGGGSIINMASVLGTVGRANAAAYVASKHGVVGLTRAAALECAQSGVRVNAVAPGFVITPLNDERLDEEARAALVREHALGRLGEEREVAAVVSFLASEESSFVTGSCQVVDGGYSAH